MITFSFYVTAGGKLEQMFSSSTRRQAAAMAMVLPFAAVGDALLGVASAVLSLLPTNRDTQLANYERFAKLTAPLGTIIPIGFVLLCIHPDPKAALGSDMDEKSEIVTHLLRPSNWLMEHAERFTRSSHRIRGHVLSRLCYLMMAVVAIATRALFLVVGLFAAPLALVHGAKNVRYNYLTVCGFAAPAVVKDLLQITLKFINPWINTPPALSRKRKRLGRAVKMPL